ncbi:MAG: hypothetical protein GON13_00100 [Nanoarchaeota archaeon]|nr:hypothetical protein [Nanoarchaeota archaeon]
MVTAKIPPSSNGLVGTVDGTNVIADKELGTYIIEVNGEDYLASIILKETTFLKTYKELAENGNILTRLQKDDPYLFLGISGILDYIKEPEKTPKQKEKLKKIFEVLMPPLSMELEATKLASNDEGKIYEIALKTIKMLYENVNMNFNINSYKPFLENQDFAITNFANFFESLHKSKLEELSKE